MCMLHGVTMLHVDAIPIIGFLKSESLKPTALSIDLFGALSGPSTTNEEYFLGFFLLVFLLNFCLQRSL